MRKLIFAFSLIIILTGCKSTKTVTEFVAVHDTIMAYKTDTIREQRTVAKLDTVREKEMHFYTLNDVGDTVKEIHHYHNLEKVVYRDSVGIYKAKFDSLKNAISKQEQKTRVYKKTASIMDWIMPLVFVVFITIICVLLLKR